MMMRLGGLTMTALLLATLSAQAARKPTLSFSSRPRPGASIQLLSVFPKPGGCLIVGKLQTPVVNGPNLLQKGDTVSFSTRTCPGPYRQSNDLSSAARRLKRGPTLRVDPRRQPLFLLTPPARFYTAPRIRSGGWPVRLTPN